MQQFFSPLFPGVILSHDNQTLTIQRVKKEDSGRYTCTACNHRGCDTSQAFLTTEGRKCSFFFCYNLQDVQSSYFIKSVIIIHIWKYFVQYCKPMKIHEDSQLLSSGSLPRFYIKDAAQE